jgi:hypothetical protein
MDTIVIARFAAVSLLPIDHVTTWSPLLHTVFPERIGWWAHAVAAKSTTTVLTTSAKTAPRLTTPRDLT